MTLEKINYQGFRNLADAELEFADDFNFIIGENGAGKTNLLEAIFYVGLGSSFRVKEERNLIRSDEQFLRIHAEADGKKAIIYLDENRKKLMLQGNEVYRLSNFVGWLGITVLSIEDIWIMRGSPAKRRSFLDWLISKISPMYLANLNEYRKILQQRNKVLQTINENQETPLLEIYDEQLIRLGNEIYRKREQYLPELRKRFTEVGAEFGLRKLDCSYHSTCSDMTLDKNILGRVRQKEIIFGHTIVGPHRDDLLFSINGRPLKHFASEGEERAAAISLKLAESEILYNKTAKRPILLLDEVGAELDRIKKSTLVSLLKGQVFYASTRMTESLFIKKKTYNVFSVKRGIFEVSSEN